jgi:serine/threonine protein kinase
MSIPWSAPELIRGDTRGDVRTEVWAYAATVYTLLAGRSPFEVSGKDNTRDTVQRRILSREAVHPTGRADVPAPLERLLAQALSKDPARRQPSILAILRGLQIVESELGLRPTPLDIPVESVIDVRQLDTARSEQLMTSAKPSRRIRTSPARSRADVSGPLAMTPMGSTVMKSWSGSPARAKGRHRLVVAGAAGVVVLLGATIALVATLGNPPDTGIPVVSDIRAAADSSAIEYSWAQPDGFGAADSYIVKVNGGAGVPQTSPSFTIDSKQAGARVCVTVTVSRNGKNGVTSDPKCVEK